MKNCKVCISCKGGPASKVLIYKQTCNWELNYYCKCGNGPTHNYYLSRTFMVKVNNPSHYNYNNYINASKWNYTDIEPTDEKVRIKELVELKRDNCTSEGCGCIWLNDSDMNDTKVILKILKDKKYFFVDHTISPQEVRDEYCLDYEDDWKEYAKDYIEDNENINLLLNEKNISESIDINIYEIIFKKNEKKI